MNRITRLGKFALLVPITAAIIFFVFLASRHLIAGYPLRIMIIPTNFVGRIFIVEDHRKGVPLRTVGFWHREVIIKIPHSGILVVQSLQPFTWITREKIISEDGTILDGTTPWGKHPGRVHNLGYTSVGSVPPENPLYPFRYRDGRVNYIEMEVAAGP